MKRILVIGSFIAVLSTSVCAQAPYPAFNQLPPNPPAAWSKAQSWQVYTLGNGWYRADIEYVDQINQAHKAQYEGTIEQLRMQINQDNQLPSNAKLVLLQALNPQPFVFSPFWFTSNPFVPAWNNNFMLNFFQQFPGIKP